MTVACRIMTRSYQEKIKMFLFEEERQGMEQMFDIPFRKRKNFLRNLIQRVGAVINRPRHIKRRKSIIAI